MAELLRPQQQEIVTPPISLVRPETLPPSGIILTPETHPLTPEYSSKLIFQSFWHSQGDLDYQTEILNHAASQNPDSKLLPQDVEETLQAVINHTTRFARSSNHFPITEAPDSQLQSVASGVTNIWIDLVNNPMKNPPHPSFLLERVIQRDEKFLDQRMQNGIQKKRYRKNPTTENIHKDEWFSFLCHYGLNRHSTGIREFDVMYSEIVDHLRKNMSFLSREEDGNLDFIVSTYNQHHPGQEARF